VIPERHLGLLPAIERGELEPLFNRAAGLLAAGTDLERLLEIAAAAPSLAQHVAAMPPSAMPPSAMPPSAEHATASLPLAQEVTAVPPLVEDTATVPLLAQEATAIPLLAEHAVNTPSFAHVTADPPSVRYAAPNPKAAVQPRSEQPEVLPTSPVIAIARDAAFNFYYGDNLELLAEAGARLVEFSPLRGEGVPEEADGIYLGGGFPEEFAAVIAANAVFMNCLRAAAAKNMPLYAECGGYMVLARTLTDRAGIVHEMAGIIPAHSVMQDKRAALGYREVTALADCLLLRKGESLRGHEFHYSVMRYDEAPRQYAYESSGRGVINPEGYVSGQIMAAYAHIHLASHQSAAYRWVEACRSFRNTKSLQIQEVQTD
jgi:cobyrinic acid a,c-diamide synthase